MTKPQSSRYHPDTQNSEDTEKFWEGTGVRHQIFLAECQVLGLNLYTDRRQINERRTDSELS